MCASLPVCVVRVSCLQAVLRKGEGQGLRALQTAELMLVWGNMPDASPSRLSPGPERGRKELLGLLDPSFGLRRHEYFVVPISRERKSNFDSLMPMRVDMILCTLSLVTAQQQSCDVVQW